MGDPSEDRTQARSQTRSQARTGHDAHFLQRLDRMSHEHLELSLGLYRDHHLVRFILASVHLPDGAERVALALADGGQGPHVIVARDGHFVTALGKGMKPGPHPIVSRAHIDGLSAKLDRVREGLDLARKRGLDSTRLLAKIESAGAAVSREDFLAAEAIIGPAAPILFGIYSSWVETVEDLLPFLTTKEPDPAWRPRGELDTLHGAWAMTHSATLLVDTASRDWVDGWASQPVQRTLSPWGFLTKLAALPFILRAAWLAARLGPPMLPSYKARYRKPANTIEAREAGFGLLALGLRHEKLRSEIWRVLRGRKPDPGEEAWVEPAVGIFPEMARIIDEKGDELRAQGTKVGRDRLVLFTQHLPESSPHRYADAASVPEDLVLPSLFNLWSDGLNGERAVDVMMVLLVQAARARAEDFYFPAPAAHALGSPEYEAEMAGSLVGMHRTLLGERKPVVKQAHVGRNEPCPCGSGKKYKKCHGR